MAKDMTRLQFHRALERHGFSMMGLWAEHRDLPNIMFGMLINGRTGKIERRASLRHILRGYDAHIRKMEAKAKEKAVG